MGDKMLGSSHVELGKVDKQTVSMEECVGKTETVALRHDITIDAKIERRITRKLDLRLIPVVTCLYMLSLIDRNNLGVARISGIDEALHLEVSNRASVATLIVYLGYCIFELPSNIALRKFGAANWVSFLCLGWGLLTLGTGFSNDYKDLVIMRAFLGAFEGGLVPALLYLLCSWYRPYEVAKRVAVFFIMASFLASFANILAYGLIQVADDPASGGWKYIYIIEGSITVGVAIIVRFLIIDFPDSSRNKFLTAEEKECLAARLLHDRGTVESDKVTWKVIGDALASWPIWAGAFMFFTSAVASYGLIIFLPTILREGLGYSLAASFCLTSPPAAFAVIVGVVSSFLSDKHRIRCPFLIFHAFVSITGLAMIGFLRSPTPRYVGAFLGYGGTYGVSVTCTAWAQNNIRTDGKRAVGTVMQVVSAGLGGIYSALVFRQQDSPDYVPGIIATMLVVALAIIVAAISMFFLRRANKQASEGLRVLENAVGFRYTL